MTEAGGMATHYHQTGIKNFLLLEFFFKFFFLMESQWVAA